MNERLPTTMSPSLSAGTPSYGSRHGSSSSRWTICPPSPAGARPLGDFASAGVLPTVIDRQALGLAPARRPARAVAVAFADGERAARVLEPQHHLAAAPAFLQRALLGLVARVVVVGTAGRSAARRERERADTLRRRRGRAARP